LTPQVEDHYFQIPMQFLAAESRTFEEMMEYPMNPDQDGSSENCPISLGNGISHDDFRQLLRVICPPNRFNAEPEVLSLSQWTSVLKLAKKWKMEAVSAHAISAIEALPSIDPVDKVVIARTYDIPAWLAPAFNEILQRAQSFTEADVYRLGLSTTLRLTALRD
ncbi:hypothetical protein BDP27DRAFT_1158226, partial [Rhodocollybia butyracea]